MVKILRTGLPEEDLEDFTVGLAGSMPLSMFGARHLYSGQGKFEWAKGLVPNDADIFVCGAPGCNHERMREYVYDFIHAILEADYTLNYLHTYYNHYVHRKNPVMIMDVGVCGLDTKLSFVQSPCCEDVRDTVLGFDFNIVQVVYDFNRNDFVIGKATLKMLEAGTMELSEYVLRDLDEELEFRDLSNFRYKRLLSTYLRILKYGARGFDLLNAKEVLKKFFRALDIFVYPTGVISSRGKVILEP